MDEFVFKYNTVNEVHIVNHFRACSTPLEGIDIESHSKKLCNFAETFEIWFEDKLIGLCACYMNDIDSKVAYITHIEINKGYKGLGLGSRVLKMVFAKALALNYVAIKLEVSINNISAINFYHKNGFVDIGVSRAGCYFMLKKLR